MDSEKRKKRTNSTKKSGWRKKQNWESMPKSTMRREEMMDSPTSHRSQLVQYAESSKPMVDITCR